MRLLREQDQMGGWDCVLPLSEVRYNWRFESWELEWGRNARYAPFSALTADAMCMAD